MKVALLIVVGGDAKPGEFKVRLPTTIGRGREANLTIPHPLVSRLHCKVFEKKGTLYVRDLGSLNGTFVNNKRVDRELPLSPGNVLTIGNIKLKAVYQPGRGLSATADADHDTDLEITPTQRTQTIQETTIAGLEDFLSGKGGPSDRRSPEGLAVDGLEDAGGNDDRLSDSQIGPDQDAPHLADAGNLQEPDLGIDSRSKH